MLKALPHRWATFGLVKVLTGLRWGEIASLDWTDVDFQAGKTNVQRATPAGTSGAQDPKSLTSRRSVDMLWPVKQALLDMPQRGRLVFPGARGGPLSYGWFSRYIWRCATAEAGSQLRLHGLRHGLRQPALGMGGTDPLREPAGGTQQRRFYPVNLRPPDPAGPEARQGSDPPEAGRGGPSTQCPKGAPTEGRREHRAFENPLRYVGPARAIGFEPMHCTCECGRG